MLTILNHLPRGSPAKCCGLLWKALSNTKETHTTQSYCQQAKSRAHYKYYLRSPYSLIHHYYKDVVTLKEAQTFVKSFPKVSGVARSQLDHIIQLIKGNGHSWKEVELFKDVLLLSPAQYSQRVQLLENLSLSQPSLYHVQWMTPFMDSTLKSLKKSLGSIFKSDPVEQLIASSTDLNLPEFILQDACDMFSADDSVTLKQVFYYLIKHYLALRFSEDPDVVGSFLDSVQPALLWKPLHHYPGMCDVFIKCLELSFSEVQEQPRLFQLDPTNTREIVQKFPNIGGTSTREVARTHPKLLQLSASHLECWLTLLHKHEVHQFTCTHHTVAVFKTNSFSKVGERLKVLKQLKEWEMIMVSDQLFEILRSQGSIKRLLNITEAGQVVFSLSSAIRASQSTRQKHWRSITPEVVSYAATTLGLPVEEIKDVLTEDIYTPFGINNTKTVLRLLLDYGFTREQVVAGAMILNLEAGVVEQALRDLHNRPEAQPFAEWMENPFVLHLLAYIIKKDIPHMDLPMKK